jgi:hypothetical protein
MRATTVERVPGLVIGWAHRGKHRYAGFDSRREAADEPTPKGLGASEPVDDEEVDAASERGHDSGLGAD